MKVMVRQHMGFLYDNMGFNHDEFNLYDEDEMENHVDVQLDVLKILRMNHLIFLFQIFILTDEKRV
jgi:hypothetical protein